MIVKQPTIEELRRIAPGFNLDMTDHAVACDGPGCRLATLE